MEAFPSRSGGTLAPHGGKRKELRRDRERIAYRVATYPFAETVMFRRIRDYLRAFKRELCVYRRVVRDRRCPRLARFFLGSAVAYLLMPFDLIPDWIPVLGQLDDLVIVPLLIWLGLRCMPADLLAEVRLAVATDAERAGPTA